MFDLLNSIDQLVNLIKDSSLNKELNSKTNDILIKLENILNNSDQLNDLKLKESILDFLSKLLLDKEYSNYVSSSCSTIILDLILRLKCDKIDLFYYLSEFICLYPEISEFVYLNYCQNFDPFSFLKQSSSILKQPNKKLKIQNTDQTSIIKILNSSLNYLYFNPNWFISNWNWTNLFNYLNNYQNNNEIKFLIYHCLRLIFNLNDELFYQKLNNEFQQDDLINLRLKYYSIFNNKKILLPSPAKICNQDQCLIKTTELNKDIISIGGILLKKQTTDNQTDLNKFVLFDSFKLNLQKLALSVRLDQPVLIEGPVGCGKTSLIECLANYVGKTCAPEITKLQMGDQIDRKLLIGSYHCTDIPGQFVWKAGPITRALIDGNWIVLEDIDLAPNELINDIVTILKTKSLDSLSGCSFVNGSVHSSFRIFFTRRLIEGFSEVYRLTDHDIIYKLCERIQFNFPEREELKQIIGIKWPNLDRFSDKLIDIFNLIQNNQLNSRTNRKVTLRDLIKLCNRISLTFNNTNKEAFTLLLDTYDCFINYLSGPERKLELAKQIGVLFNFTNEQVNAIYSKRKPTIEINDNQFKIGRYTLPIKENREFKETNTIFAFNLQSLLLLEQIAASIYHSESLLLVGETGCGKTSTIQFLASKLKKNLTVINLNQQTDSTDIIGGYKPIAFSFIAKKLKNQFEELFKDTFSIDQNISFLNNLLTLFEQEKWKKFIAILDHITTKALIKENLNSNLQKRWNLFKKKLDNLKNREFEKFLAFEFIEGNLVNAIKNGDWVLLDEINLAESETLQFLSYILDENNKSFQLLDKNDDNKIIRHNEFRLFACMNPSTDVGKKELPIGVRNLFTEIFVEELELTSDLQILTQTYIGNLVNSNQIDKIVQLYIRLKKDSKQSLNGYSSGPYYSLRTFCRALRVSSTNLCKNIKKTLYEAFCLSFLTQLDLKSHDQVQNLIFTYLFGKEKINLNKILTPKPDENAIELENFLGYWLPKGTKNPILDTNYILTDSVKRNLFNLIRIISIGRVFPILLQGETSVGKTSMIEWLAQATGNVCYRINNHDHIDLQEYVGNYTVDKFGKLVFKEGLLVEAMRNGYWLILDELNLASTEVLEALNRVLDDNREIFIPEIQDTIKAHPKFLLFATQNPPETYGGRKLLSRAFRNRFIELQFDEIPGKELEIILSRRCYLPPSYSKKMVDVFRELRNRRRESGIFAGKSGFVTLRDLFRWGERYKEYSSTIEDKFFNWEQYLANEGYILIGGRVRKEDELLVVKEVLEIKFKTKITDQFLIDNFNELINLSNLSEKFKHIVWTKNSIRLCCLLFRALKYREPVLLVGGTGIGKTTFCQLYAELTQNQLYTVNCHMNTESSDFIGSLRPVRSSDENKNNNKLFEWQDGPLVNAMNNGSTFLVDEISLADDSVLERLNSLLEPKRTLFLAEKTTSEEYIEDQINGESENIKIVAKDSFRFVATMNPGGDYAKKELSPALRNRFTEIWCSSVFDEEDIKKIIVHNLNSNLKDHHIKISDLICEFLNWFNNKIISKTDYSIRDILTIIEFINTTTDSNNEIILPTYLSVSNSIELLYIDSIGSSAVYSYFKTSELKNDSKIFLNQLIKKYFSIDIEEINDQTILNVDLNKYFGYKLFYIPYGSNQINQTKSYIMNSKSVNANCCKVLKAMQLSKSILLEGNPGTGKTSLIDALAKAAGYQLIRINLSEQTDINDLFGADLPVEGEEAKFSWRDGPLLKALKTESTWILLDELNLASQSVLEGLNACLDHRGEIFIPELNRTFILNKSKTRIFASQNPHLQGGGRKGLPKSFMNRFITIFIDAFSTEDMIFILENIFNEIPKTIIEKMVSFNEELIEETKSRKKFSSAGLPWEFNLRDMTRWCELVIKEKFKLNNEFVFEPEKFIDLIYVDRFRSLDDKKYAIELFEKHFNTNYSDQLKGFKLTKNYLQIGNSILERKSYLTSDFDYQLIPQQTKTLESVMKCCEMGWMTILVGDTNVSKSSVINLLSILTGNTLKVLSVNSEMDSTELLGRFRTARLKEKCINLIELITRTRSINGNGTFEWIDSVLIESIQNGHWLLIENANLCSASVLDRINSLLEPNGFLIINERGSIDNEIPIIKPHPQFRLFLTMNSKNGELSRAMRNRGIEIYLTNNNLLNTTSFIMKNFDNTKLNLDKCKLLNLFIQTIENQKDLKDKLTSKFFTYYLLYMMKSLNLNNLNEISLKLDDLKLKEELFSIRSLIGDTELFILNNNLEIINNLDHYEDNKIYESIAFRLILESTSKNIQIFLLNLYNLLFKECFDETMINYILNLNQQFLNYNNSNNHQLDVNELSIDLRYSMSLIKKLIIDHDTFNQLSLNTNIWSIKLFYNQLINYHKLNFNQNQISLSTIEQFVNRNEFDKYLPKLFIENITKLLAKLNGLEFNLNQQLDDNQYMELRSLFNWIHHLIGLCEINITNPNDILIILDKFINLWIICFQKNIFNQLGLFNLDLNSEIGQINQSLNINHFDNIKDYDKLIKKFLYQIVPKNANTSTFYSLIWKCMNELFNKDYWFLLKNKELINKFINIYKNVITDNELESVETELKFIIDRVRNPNAFQSNKFDYDDDERKIDLELKQKFQNSQLTFEANLHSIYQMMFFVMEIQSIDLFNSQKDNLSILNNLRSLLTSNNIIINPFHQYLFQNIEQTNDNKFELILHHFLDSFKLFRNDTTFNLVNFHDTFNLDLTKDNLTQYEFKLKSFLNDNYWYKEEFIANTSPVFTLILTKSLLQDNLRLGYLNYQQKQVEEIMKLVPQNYLNFFGTFLNSKIYYENLFECWVNLIVNNTIDLTNYQTLRNNLLQIIEQLKENTKDGQSNYLMSLIGVFTCKLFQPINALDPVQRSNCKLTNYELELNLIDVELELRMKFCRLNYARNFNEQEDHPHIQKLFKRKDDLIRKINKLNLTQNFRPIPSLYFKLKSEINHFTDNVICNQNFETSLICLKDYIDLDETKLATSDLINQKIIDNIELMVNFKKKINYFLNDLLSKYSQYYDLLCNYLIGIALIYQSISWLLSNANKRLALSRLDINSKLLNKINHLFSYSNNEPNLTTDHLLSLLNSTKLTDMLSKTRSGLQHCHTMLYKATLMEILNAFAFQTDHNQTVKLMNCLIQKFLDTWKKQEEIKRLKQEEEEALYHYKIRNENEIVNDEEQLTNDINLNFPTFEDLYSDLMDNDENREFQLNRLEHQQLNEDDVYLKPEIILEIIDLHRLITESVCKETKLEFNFKQSFKLRYSILSELIESYGPLFNQTLDEIVLDGHLIIYDNLNQNVFNQQLDGFNIYTDYNVDEIRKCFSVLEKLKEKIINNLEDQMFCGHVTLRRLLKFILRIYSIQVTQPLIKFLTGLEIILKIAQDWEEIAPKEYKLIDELEIVKELIISWRQIELRNYQNCLDNVFKRIRNQDFLKWWFHFYSMLTEILASNDNEIILNDFYLNLKKFIDESTIGEFSNRLILIENFILHASCINCKHQVITLMKNLLNYYKQIEPKIIDHIKVMRIEFDKQIKDKVKIIKWKKVNYFGLKNLITKSHRTVMKNMNKFTRSLSEQSYLHFYNFNTMIEQPKLKWQLNVLNLKDKLIINTDQQFDSQLIKELKYLNNLEQFNQKCCKLIVKCLTKSTVYESRISEFNELSNDIVINIKDLQELTVDPKLTDKEQRKKQIKQITNKKDHQLSELIKLLKSIGISYQKGLNHLEKLDFSIIQTIKLNENSSHLNQQSNSDLQSTEVYFYKLFNKFVYFLDASKLPSKDINQQKLDKFKGSILNLMMKIVKNRANLSEQLDNFNQLNQSINLLGKLDKETILTKKLKSVLDLIRNLSIQFKILLIQCQDVLNVLSKSSELNEIMKLYSNEIPKLIAILDEISIPKSIPLFNYTKEEINYKFSKLNSVINKVTEYLANLVDINNRSKNGVLMNTLQFAFELKEKINLINLDLELNKDNVNNENNQTKFNELIDETEKFIQKVFFKVQETFKYLTSNEFNEIKKDDDDKILIDLEKIDNLTKIIGLKSIKDQFVNYLERTQIVGLDISLEECESIKKLLINLVTIINNYLVCVEHYINLYITKNRCLNKLTYILLGLFNELSKNGFCIPPDLQDQEEQNENDGQFKEIDDGGIGSGEGKKDVSDQIQNLNQIEGLENEDENEQQEKPEEDEMKEEEKGIQMDDDFKGETFDKDEKDDESDKSDDEENEMGDVENDDNVLDENIWGKSDDESSEIDENEKGTDNKKGEEQTKEELVANEDNDNLDKSSKEDKQKEFDKKLNEEEMNDDEKQEDIDKNETDQFKKDKDDKNLDVDDLPENLELDDELEESENDEENTEVKDDLEVSNLDENDEDSSIDENEENMNMSETEEQQKEENNENSDQLNLDDEIRVEKDEDANEEMEIEDNNNALDSKTQNYDENMEFNEDLKNRNETMNQQQSSNEEQDSGLDKQQQKAFSYENKSSLITEQTINEDQIESANDLNIEDNKNLDNNNKKLSDNKDKNLKRKDILKNDNKNRFKKEDKKPNDLKSDLYRHIDDNLSGEEDIIDKADESHSNNIEIDDDKEEDKNKEDNKIEKLNDIEMLDEEINENSNKMKQIKNQKDETSNNKKDENLANDSNANELDNNRPIISTTFIQRPSETIYHTDLDKLDNKNSKSENIDKLEHIDNLLERLSSNVKLEDDEVDKEASLAWRECEQIVSPLINELTAQLQLILEPTKTTKFKGDYKTGKRLNMRKIIPYIASQYRKDKIWLRRTKPSKREYQIMLALDDSGSMADNHSKKLAFESLILLGKSLNLLEVGEIGIMSFGEDTKIVNSFDEPFNDTIGSKLFSQFTFKQKKTRINDLLSKVKLTMESFRFNKKARELSQLLMIISDGRGLFSEGETQLKTKIKQIYDSGIFIVFLILDNPEHKDSICDIVVPKFESNGEVSLKSYMEEFPFPFYIIVRNIEQLPNVLGQALRQWFELVSVNDK